MVSPILPLIVGRIFFFRFGMFCFICIVWSCLGIFLVFFLSLEFLVGFLDFLKSLVAVLYQFRPNISKCSVLVFLLVVNQVWVPTRVLTFCLWSSRGPRFFQRLILFLRILNPLTPWCRLSGYLSIRHSLFRFQTGLFYSLSSWEKALWFSLQTFNGIDISFSLLRLCVCGACTVWLGFSGFVVFSILVTVLRVCWCVWLCIC